MLRQQIYKSTQVPQTHTPHLSPCVAENDSLCDGQRVVQVTQSVKLPLLLLHSNKELLDSLQSQLITKGKRQGEVSKRMGVRRGRGEK